MTPTLQKEELLAAIQRQGLDPAPFVGFANDLTMLLSRETVITTSADVYSSAKQCQLPWGAANLALKAFCAEPAVLKLSHRNPATFAEMSEQEAAAAMRSRVTGRSLPTPIVTVVEVLQDRPALTWAAQDLEDDAQEDHCSRPFGG